MPTQAEVVWDPGFTRYDFGPRTRCPRCGSTSPRASATRSGCSSPASTGWTPPSPPTSCSRRSTARLRRRGEGGVGGSDSADGAYGLGTDDDPAFVGMHDASARVVAGTRDLCEAVWTGQTEHGVNFCGGLHHAMPTRPPGSASTTTWPSGSAGCSTTAWSASPTSTWTCTTATASSGSSGTTTAFSPCRSTSRDGPVPGHRLAVRHRRRRRAGVGHQHRPPARGRRRGWLRAFHSTALPVVRAFRPQVLVSQHGCDTHAGPPGAPRPDGGRPARGGRDAAPAQPRRMRRALGRARRRRVRDRRRRAAGVDAPHRDRRAPSDPRERAFPRTGASTCGS